MRNSFHLRRGGWLMAVVSLSLTGCVTPPSTLDPLAARIVSHSELRANTAEARFVMTFVVDHELTVKDLTLAGTGATKRQNHFELNFDEQKTSPEAYTLQGVPHAVFQLSSMWAVLTAMQSKDVPLYLKWDEARGVAAISKDPAFRTVEAWPALKIEAHAVTR